MTAPTATANFAYQGDELTLFANARNWKGYFSSFLKPFITGNVVEVGAGLGNTTRMLCAGQSSWICLEPDASMAEQIAQEIAEGRLPSCCRVEVGTVAQMLARGDAGQFDSAIYIDVLEHVEDDRAELEAAARLLKPGGYLVVLSPAFQWLYSPYDTAIGHFRRYDRHSLGKAAPPGLRSVLMRYLDSIGLLSSLANRVVLRSSMPNEKQILAWDRLMVPVSRVVDPLLGYSFGRSILGVWQK